ncbi:unnamed protein product [Urochloa humidicola]
MVLFKYGFIFLAGAGFGAAVAHRGQGCCDHRRHGPCWRRHRGGGDDLGGRRHELDPAAAASYEDERRGYHFRPSEDRDAEEGKYRAVKKNKKQPAAAVATSSDY